MWACRRLWERGCLRAWEGVCSFKIPAAPLCVMDYAQARWPRKFGAGLGSGVLWGWGRMLGEAGLVA